MSEVEEPTEVKAPKDPNAFKVSQSKEKGCRSIELSYDFGDTTGEAVEKFGEDIVHGFYLRGVKVAVQSQIRSLLVEGKTDEEILASLETWKPGVHAKRSGGGRKKKSIEDQFNEMSEEEQQALLAKLMG